MTSRDLTWPRITSRVTQVPCGDLLPRCPLLLCDCLKLSCHTSVLVMTSHFCTGDDVTLLYWCWRHTGLPRHMSCLSSKLCHVISQLYVMLSKPTIPTHSLHIDRRIGVKGYELSQNDGFKATKQFSQYGGQTKRRNLPNSSLNSVSLVISAVLVLFCFLKFSLYLMVLKVHVGIVCAVFFYPPMKCRHDFSPFDWQAGRVWPVYLGVHLVV